MTLRDNAVNDARGRRARKGALGGGLAVALATLACTGLCGPLTALPQLAPTPVPPASEGGPPVGGPDSAGEGTLTLVGGEPRTLDPALWTGGPDGIVGDLFSGLVLLDTTLQPIPDLAETWAVSPDGLVYTFTLRRNVTFHDGRPFNAEDVLFSWERALDPETESDTASTYLGDIAGAAELADGRATSLSGVRVVDDYTLEVTLDAPKAYFLYKLAYPTSWIVDHETVDDIETAPNGTGPFVLQRHEEEEIIVVTRNPTYYRGNVALAEIVYLLNPGPSVRLYEAGDVDFVYIDEDLLERANDPADPLFGTVHTETSLCTEYVSFDATRPPFDEGDVRRAFALAIDKARYNDVVFSGLGTVAGGLFPPGLPGFNTDLVPLDYDPQAAVSALAASSYGGPEGLPPLTFTTSGVGDQLGGADGLLIQMWAETLGVQVTPELLDPDNLSDEIYAGRHGEIITDGWCADYPDPENFADVLFHTGAHQNAGGYSNADVDGLLEEARSTPDVAARLRLYQEAEQVLVSEAASVFLNHYYAYYSVTKPYVQGYVAAPIGVAQHMNLSIKE